MAAPTGNALIQRGNRFRVHSLASGGWRIGFTTRLGYRDFPPGDPATDAAFSAFATMTTADQIDAAAGDLMARGLMTRSRALGAVTAALCIALVAGQARADEHLNPCQCWQGYMRYDAATIGWRSFGFQAVAVGGAG